MILPRVLIHRGDHVPAKRPLPPPTTTRELLDRYDVFLLDGHGVLVSSTGALPGSAHFLRRIKEMGKQRLLLSNDASRSPVALIDRYRAIGLELDLKHVLTSGLLLREYFTGEGLRGKRCIVLGTEDSLTYVTEAGGIIVAPSDESADVVVLADQDGYPFLDTLNDVVTVLLWRIECGSGTRLILANPDLLYPRDSAAFGVAAGAVAAMIEATLVLRDPSGAHRFVPIGKPYAPMFEAAIRRVPGQDRRRIVMIGDQLETDIVGAVRFGIDSVLVLTGIGRLSDLATSDIRPTYTLERL